MGNGQVEVFIPENADTYMRDVLPVVAFRRIPDGVLVRRVEPVSVRDADEPGRPPVVAWATTERLVAAGTERVSEDDLTVCLLPVGIGREVALAVLAHYDKRPGTYPSDAEALRRDLEHERQAHTQTRRDLRVVTDRLGEVTQSLASRQPRSEPPPDPPSNPGMPVRRPWWRRRG